MPGCRKQIPQKCSNVPPLVTAPPRIPMLNLNKLNLNELHDRLSPTLRFTLAGMVIALALMLRLWALPVESGLAFMTFYPAMIICYYLFGIGPGIFASAISAVLVHYFFIPPYRHLLSISSGDIAVVNFLFASAVIGYVVNQLQRYSRQVLSTVDELHVAATAFESQESLVITDAKGIILRVNRAFTESTGYTAEEAIGKNPRHLLRSGRHNKDFYLDMWDTIKRTGKWQGEIWDRRKNGDVYPKWLSISTVRDAGGVITHYVGSHIDITERKSSEEKIRHLAFYDYLTDLPNRRLLLDRLDKALAVSARNGWHGALLFLDIDHFKTINDTRAIPSAISCWSRWHAACGLACARVTAWHGWAAMNLWWCLKA